MNPVKLYVADLFAAEALLAQALVALEARFGAVDVRGAPVPFDHTDYYAPELGRGLRRTIAAFAELVPPPFIVAAKWAARDIERALSQAGRRRVNLDVGFLDAFKVTLASFKERGNKVYLDRDVWLDIQLTFERGKLHPLPWTFPEFRAARYDADLLRIRARYREQSRLPPHPAE
jgi:hypothetical protein